MLKDLPNRKCCNTSDARDLCPKCAAAYNAAHQMGRAPATNAATTDLDEFTLNALFGPVENAADPFDPDDVLPLPTLSNLIGNEAASQHEHSVVASTTTSDEDDVLPIPRLDFAALSQRR